MTAEEKARIFNKAYKEHKYHIAEAEQSYITDGLQEAFKRSPYAGREMLIPYEAFQNPAFEIMKQYAVRRMSELQAKIILNSLAGEMYCLNQWAHYGKEVYDFNESLAIQLADDAKDFDLNAPIPLAVLGKMPGQGFFISIPPTRLLGGHSDGFFVNRSFKFGNSENSDGSMTKRLNETITFTAVMFEDGYIRHTTTLTQPLDVPGVHTIQDALNWTIENTESRKAEGEDKGKVKRTQKILKFFWEFLLYLCAENAEIKSTPPLTERTGLPGKAKDNSGTEKKKSRTPSIKKVGEEEGIRIKQLKAGNYRGGAYNPPAFKSPSHEKSPHMRRSHWHSYWVGKHGTEERRLILKWLPPAYIHPEKMDGAKAAVTRIENSEEK